MSDQMPTQSVMERIVNAVRLALDTGLTKKDLTPHAVAVIMREVAPEWMRDDVVLAVYEAVLAHVSATETKEPGVVVPDMIKGDIEEWRGAVERGETILGFYDWMNS